MKGVFLMLEIPRPYNVVFDWILLLIGTIMTFFNK